MSKKKAGGKVSQQHQRAGKRLGVKISGGQLVSIGTTLVRQRGTKYGAGSNVIVGRDHTLVAIKRGSVVFKEKQGKQFVSVVE